MIDDRCPLIRNGDSELPDSGYVYKFENHNFKETILKDLFLSSQRGDAEWEAQGHCSLLGAKEKNLRYVCHLSFFNWKIHDECSAPLEISQRVSYCTSCRGFPIIL